MPRGFTLFELVISIAVLSILLMAAGPSFTRLLEDQSVKDLRERLKVFLFKLNLNLFYKIKS